VSKKRLTLVAGFTSEAISALAKKHIAPGSAVFSDGWACFGAVTEAGCTNHPTVMAGRKLRDLPEFQWINTVLPNLKTSFSGCYHAFNFQKYAARYLAAFTCAHTSPATADRSRHRNTSAAALVPIS
jgi:hypothetical protein